jgi:hypothetical protein
MAAPTDPRRLVGPVLGLLGLDGGNARALANARGILDGLQAAREEVDALELRLSHRLPRGSGGGWPVSPNGSAPTPSPPRAAPRRGSRTNASPHAGADRLHHATVRSR